jgi:hypothetical protein
VFEFEKICICDVKLLYLCIFFRFLIQIFSEKVEINAAPKIDAINPNYKRRGGNKQITVNGNQT